jgi:hypothetical protein
MRKLLIVALLLLVAAGAHAQTGTETLGDTIRIETRPSFQGGDFKVFLKWVSERISYPKDLIKFNIEGTVVANFVIDTDGTLSDIKIVESPHPLLSKEVVRLLMSSPKWSPGTQSIRLKDGTILTATAVKSFAQIPVSFNIAHRYDRIKKAQPRTFTGKIYNSSEVDIPPAFADAGNGSFESWLSEQAGSLNGSNKKTTGNTGVIFIVEPDGSLSGIQVLNPPSEKIAKKIRRLLDDMPERKPGVHGGQRVRTQSIIILL